MYDWMHTYAVGGLWNVELGALVGKLSAHGVGQERLRDELNRFTWPSYLSGRGVTGVNIFAKEDQDGEDSPLLFILLTIRLLVIVIIPNRMGAFWKTPDSNISRK